MKSEIERMLEHTNPNKNEKDRLREVLQNLTLYGLSTTGFLERAAFYGGTALRLFHGLDRFSEDLDFSLKEPDMDFTLDPFILGLEKSLRSFGLEVDVSIRNKNIETNIKSAFLKSNTKELMLEMYPNNDTIKNIVRTEVTKIKFEVDIDPPPYANYETLMSTDPYLFPVILYDMPSLFAGKLNAMLCRGWKNRVKGRDLYDFLFYISNDVPVNMRHLEARLRQTGCIDDDCTFDSTYLMRMMVDKFKSIDFDSAKKDVISFIDRPEAVDGWNADSFIKVSERLRLE